MRKAIVLAVTSLLLYPASGHATSCAPHPRFDGLDGTETLLAIAREARTASFIGVVRTTGSGLGTNFGMGGGVVTQTMFDVERAFHQVPSSFVTVFTAGGADPKTGLVTAISGVPRFRVGARYFVVGIPVAGNAGVLQVPTCSHTTEVSVAQRDRLIAAVDRGPSYWRYALPGIAIWLVLSLLAVSAYRAWRMQ